MSHKTARRVLKKEEFAYEIFQVSKHYKIPVRALILNTVIGCLLGLVNIGSSTAFDAMTSLSLIGHYTSYALPICLLMIRRFDKKDIPWGPWTLGKWGLSINIFSVVFSIVLIVFMVFPPYQPVSVKNMNYAGLIFGAVLILSAVLWFCYGRKIYHGPVREVIDELHIK